MMEQSKKQLKISSILVLLFGAVMILNAVTAIISDFDGEGIPSDVLEENLLLAKIIVGGVTLLFVLAYLYVGLKGLKIAKNPDASRGHIRCAKVLFVLSVLSLISPIVAIFQRQNVGENIMDILSLLVDVIVFFDFIKHAKAVAKGQ